MKADMFQILLSSAVSIICLGTPVLKLASTIATFDQRLKRVEDMLNTITEVVIARRKQ